MTRPSRADDTLREVTRFMDEGLFRDALSTLDQLPPEVVARLPVQTQKAELLERIGRRREAEGIARHLLRSRTLTPSDRSLCEFVLGRLRIDEGEFDQAVALLNRAATSAKRGGNIERLCLSQLKLLALLSDGVGADATGPLLAEVKSNAFRTGNGRILAAVHVYCAQIEAQRGLLGVARRHSRLARNLLKDSPNVWLESVLENIDLAVSIIASEFEQAEGHARRGQELAERTGGAIEFAVNQANSGFLWHVLGRLNEAVDCYERAIVLLVPGSDPYNGAIDSLARVRLSQGRFAECEELLASIDETPKSLHSRGTYVARHVAFTRAQLAAKKANVSEACERLERVIQLSREAGDHLLLVESLLTKAELLACSGVNAEVRFLLEDIGHQVRSQPVHIFAQHEKVTSRVCRVTENLAGARDHYLRAERAYLGLHHVQGLADLRSITAVDSVPGSVQRTSDDSARSVLHSAIAIMEYAKHPEYIARELLAILVETNAINSAAVVTRLDSGAFQTIAEVGRSTEPTSNQLRLPIGKVNDRIIEIVLEPAADIEKTLAARTALALVGIAFELLAARDERGARTTIWSTSDPPDADSRGAIISGHMRELMTFAQRVARTSVNVMITGESGTGKEILARAVHDFSDRAQKPFVPLNCAAVPRDLLESQLFGHRRGAFTGADRDHLGLVRSAEGGTVFLDEIGEMGLDLQPKLLRFLESGEISPLGEPAPFIVSVRVIAATNANLEDAVRDGKFREDLFYRLNVVRLAIRPLRERRDEIPSLVTHFVDSAAREYKKGHLEVSEETMERLLLYRWPGNVRQLQNEIRRMVALAEPGSTLEPDAISADILGALPVFRHPSLNGREVAVPLHGKLAPMLSRIEYEMIKAALRANHGRLEPAARSLGISRKGLYLKRQRLGL
jgi:DNA-binding NtrC family response regulator/tetratricopeptide (TPR) repeat protein